MKAEAPAGPALGLPSPEVESGLERGEPEPMEVEEGELEIVPVRRSLKELLPVRARGAGAEEVAERVSLARQGGGGQRRWRKSGNAGEGRERRKAGAAHDPESAREKGRRGARKWVQRALEEAGGGSRKESGTPLSLPLGAGPWPGTNQLCLSGDKREPRAGTEPGSALKGSVRCLGHPGLLVVGPPTPAELVSLKQALFA